MIICVPEICSSMVGLDIKSTCPIDLLTTSLKILLINTFGGLDD